MDAAARASLLAESAMFGLLPRHELLVLAEMMQSETFLAAQLVFEVGEPADRVFVVASGTLDVIVAGRADPIRTLGTGEVVGEYGMLVGFVRTATVRAQTEAVLLALDYERFRAYLLQYPEAMLRLFQQAVKRLVGAERRTATSS